jgi:hypothetical protein
MEKAVENIDEPMRAFTALKDETARLKAVMITCPHAAGSSYKRRRRLKAD